MRLEIFKNYQQLHTWVGILSGLLLFICFFAGAVTMFKGPLNQWALQTDSQLPGIATAQYDTLIEKVLHAHPEASKAMTVYLPAAMPQHAPVQWVIENPDTHATTLWQASLDSNGTLLSRQTSVSAVGDFLDRLHRTAGIPGGDDHDAYGIFVMGFICILYFVALVSGLVIFLPTWFKDLFSFRKGDNNKRFFVDFHNILGISALPFHIIIALTTIVFAYHDVLYGAMREGVFKEQPLFYRPAPAPATEHQQQLLPIASFEQTIQQIEPQFVLTELRLNNLTSPNAIAIVGGLLEGEWIRGPKYAYWITDPYTASAGYTDMLPSNAGLAAKIVNGFFTLHFGSFGGHFIHWIYFALGICGSLLFLTGNILWVEARRKQSLQPERPLPQRRDIKILARLTTGSTLGCLLGIAIALLLAKVLPHQTLQINFWQHCGYYSTFLLCTFAAFIVKPSTLCQHLLSAIGVVLLLISLASVLSIHGRVDLGLDLIVALVCTLFAVALFLTRRHLKRRFKLAVTDQVWH